MSKDWRDWRDWRIEIPPYGKRVPMFEWGVSSIAFDRLVGAEDKCELVVGDKSGNTEAEVIKYDSTTIIASREMPDTPEELLAWYTMVVRMHVD